MLARNDNRVTAEISELFLPPLAQALKRRFPNLPDPHLTETVAIDTLLAYFERPNKFDPAKGSLLDYLYLDASHDLLNLIKQQQKFVELHLPLLEHEVQAVESENPEARLLAQDLPLVRRAVLRQNLILFQSTSP